MGDLKRKVQDETGVLRSGEEGPEGGRDNARTAGTNRDYDASQESANQGHGHSREGRERSEDAGRSERSVTDTDRQERDLGGPGG